MSKFSIAAKADGSAEITLYDVIDRFWGISAAAIYEQLKELGDVKSIRVRINSPGGSVFEGMAIYNLLKQHAARVTVSVDGLAASMASVVAMAGDDIEIGEGAYLMIHDPLGFVRGGSEDMREMAELLDKIRDQIIGVYARRTAQSEDQIREWMQDETWMTADEAVTNGFASRSVAGLKIAAMAPVNLFEHPPQSLLAGKQQHEEPNMANEILTPATWQELKACCPGADADFLGKQIDAGATTIQAASAWMTELQLRAEIAAEEKVKAEQAKAEAEKQAAEAKADVEKIKAARPGVEPLGDGGGQTDQSGDPVADFQAAVAAKMSAGLNRVKATASVVREQPKLHAAYIEAANAK